MRERWNKAGKNKKGFTMVELIVVIVIILVLAAVLVPNVMKYIDKAAQASCKNDAASMLTQVQADVADEFAVKGTIPEEVTVNDNAVAKKVETLTIAAKGTGIAGEYTVTADGQVSSFAYQNGKHYILWSQASGWSGIQ